MPIVMNYQAEHAAVIEDLIKLIKTRGAALVAAQLSILIEEADGTVDQKMLEQTLQTFQAKPPPPYASYAASSRAATPPVSVQEIRRIVKEELIRFNF